MSPGELISVAEENGLMIALGAHLLATACTDAVAWRAHAPDVGVAVNISARQLADPDLVATVRAALDRSGLPAGSLRLEITEAQLVDGAGVGVTSLRTLADLGVGIALDDFGTGWSSLSSLTHLPFDQLKIDLSFVHGMQQRRQDAAVVEATLGLAHALRLDAVAEGVETAAQAELLRGMGCDALQGYLFSPPVPPARVPDLLSQLGADRP